MPYTLRSLKVLVLGGRGFLGTHLVSALLEEGCAVRVLTRAIMPSGGPPGVEWVHGDFVSGRGVADALHGVDVVYHLLSTTVPSDSNADPMGDVNSNLVATLRLLKLMNGAGVKRIVYASSGGTVYGNPAALPVPEQHPLQPICSYGIVKAAVEGYLSLHAKRDGLIANTLRIANPYGAYQSRIGTQGVIATFVHHLLNNHPIEIWGDGSATRDYVYVPDVVRALVLAGRRTESGTFNIGSGVGHSVNDVLSVV